MRNYKRKTNQTRPDVAGAKNLPEKHIKRNTMDEGYSTPYLSEMYSRGVEQSRRSTNWTPEELEATITEYFIYCEENSLKPCKSGLQLFLGCTRETYSAWGRDRAKYGAISDKINLANLVMETQYIQNIEDRPTGNMFLLRTSHNHVEKSQVDVTTSNQTNAEDIDEAIKKLGLNK